MENNNIKNDDIENQRYWSIYLLEERESIRMNDNIFKVGRTQQNHCGRFNQYPQGSRLICQFECKDGIKIETKLLNIFKNKFKQMKLYGNEYFQGDYKEMKKIIYLTIENEDKNEKEIYHNYIKDHDIKISKNDIKNEIYKIIFKEFPNIDIQKNKYIKFSECFDSDDNEIICGLVTLYVTDEIVNNITNIIENYIKITYEDTNKDINFYNMTHYLKQIIDNNKSRMFGLIKHYFVYKEDFINYSPMINNLIKKEKIIINKVYHYDEIIYILEENIIKINIEFYDKFINYYNLIEKNTTVYKKNTEIKSAINLHDTLYEFIEYSPIIINNKIYCFYLSDINLDNWNNFDKREIFINFNINFSFDDDIYIYKINNKYYCYKSFLKIYIPYIILWDNNKNYYIKNFDNKYIINEPDENNCIIEGEEYLFNDDSKPWYSNDNIINLINKYDKIIIDNSLKKKNNCEIYNMLLSLL